MYCQYCGSKITEGAKFCNICGSKVDMSDSISDNQQRTSPHDQTITPSPAGESPEAPGTTLQQGSQPRPSENSPNTYIPPLGSQSWAAPQSGAPLSGAPTQTMHPDNAQSWGAPQKSPPQNAYPSPTAALPTTTESIKPPKDLGLGVALSVVIPGFAYYYVGKLPTAVGVFIVTIILVSFSPTNTLGFLFYIGQIIHGYKVISDFNRDAIIQEMSKRALGHGQQSSPTTYGPYASYIPPASQTNQQVSSQEDHNSTSTRKPPHKSQ